ncbi:UNVERIFIED_CONTAM: Ser/Thr protein kinase RdoA (MazF antagonist) [Brevibacillus sp. OAP136]
MAGQHIGSGKTADVYICEGGNVLKLFKPEVPMFLVDQELLAHEAVMGANLPVPRTFGKVEAEGRLGIVYERVDGTSLIERLIHQPEAVTQLANEFAALHRRVHQAKAEKLPGLQAILKRNLHVAEPLTADEKQAVATYIDQLPVQDQLCHMDFHPDNILYTAGGPVILDWMTAVSGNALADVARTIVILKYASLPPNLPEPVKEGVMAIRERFVADYQRAYFAEEEERESEMEAWFLPIMAARLCEGVPSDEKERLVLEIRNRLQA